MNRTRRTIGLSAFVMLAVLGTGWALEKASSNSRTKDGAAVSEPAKASDAIPTSRELLVLLCQKALVGSRRTTTAATGQMLKQRAGQELVRRGDGRRHMAFRPHRDCPAA